MTDRENAPSSDQLRTDTIATLRGMTHPLAAVVISRTLRDGRPRVITSATGWHSEPPLPGGGVLDDATATQATEDILAELASAGLTVTRPPVLSAAEVDKMLDRVRPVWEDAGGDETRDDGLRAVIAELTMLIAYRLGHRW